MTVGLTHHVFVCEKVRAEGHALGCCSSRKGPAVRKALKKLVARGGLAESIRINSAGCLDRCEEAVAIVVYPEGVWYGGVTLEDCNELFESHLKGGRPVERLRMDRPIGEAIES